MNESLNTWNLTDLYNNTQDPHIQTDLKFCQESIDSFHATYFEKISTLSGHALGTAISLYEEIQERFGKLLSFAFLNYATDTNNTNKSSFYQNMQEKVSDLSTKLVFFPLEMNTLDQSTLQKLLDSTPSLQKYKMWIETTRLFRKHQLSNDLELLMKDKSIPSHNSWIRLYDETSSRLRFDFEDKRLTLTEILEYFSHKEESYRKKAALSFAKGLKDNIELYTLITNTLAKNKAINDTWRNFQHPISSRNLENLVEDDVVNNLISTVKDNYSNLSHRYYKLKARWLQKDTLNYWDRNAPLPFSADQEFSWEEAKEIVFKSYEGFCPNFAAIVQEFYKNNWIDASVKQGKMSGAFAHPTVPSAHPYILLNYQGKVRDVMTLAHELGHGIHQILAHTQGYLQADTPLTLAETASVFGEMLTFHELKKRLVDPKHIKALLANKVEDMLSTVVRQIAFCQFEQKVHEQRRLQELTPEDINTIWIETQYESFGPIFEKHDSYKYYWAYIPHFIHNPFYVYAYAFGDCLVNSLFSLYQQGFKNFHSLYTEFLTAGGSQHYTTLLRKFNLDPHKTDFWQQGLNVIHAYIDQLEDYDT